MFSAVLTEHAQRQAALREENGARCVHFLGVAAVCAAFASGLHC
jgi:hypothetical protein